MRAGDGAAPAPGGSGPPPPAQRRLHPGPGPALPLDDKSNGREHRGIEEGGDGARLAHGGARLCPRALPRQGRRLPAAPGPPRQSRKPLHGQRLLHPDKPPQTLPLVPHMLPARRTRLPHPLPRHIPPPRSQRPHRLSELHILPRRLHLPRPRGPPPRRSAPPRPLTLVLVLLPPCGEEGRAGLDAGGTGRKQSGHNVTSTAASRTYGPATM